MDVPFCSPACSSLSCVSVDVEKGWVLERGVWRVDTGRRQLLAVKRQSTRMGVRSSTIGNVHGRSLGRQRSRAPLLSDPQDGDCHFSPLPHAPLSSWILGGAPPRAGSHAHPSQPLPLPTRAGQICSGPAFRGTCAEVGLKSQPSPRGHATKREELKSLLTATGAADSHAPSLSVL